MESSIAIAPGALDTFFSAPSFWLHADGGVYRLLSMATCSQTGAPTAIYEHLHPFERGVWTRPLDEFRHRFSPLGPNGAAALLATDKHARQIDIASRKAERRAREAAELQTHHATPKAKLYCLGFMFSADSSRVALIRKATPAWQAGKLNGVGGKAEIGESAATAMAREFFEETGVSTRADSWELFARMGSPHFEVHVFRCFDDQVDSCRTLTHEEVLVCDFDPALLLGQGVAGVAALACCALERETSFTRIDYDEWADEARLTLGSILSN
jgi:8-oxo-dGTP diphosphatase